MSITTYTKTKIDALLAPLYTKPSGGIPKTDLVSGVQTSLGSADTAYQKPGSGIPASDLTSAAQAALTAAGSAKQKLASPQAKSAAFTVAGWTPYLADISAGSYAANLPAANTVAAGTEVYLKVTAAPAAPNIGTTTLSVTPNGTDTINGATAALPMRYLDQGKTLVCDGASNWTVISGDFSQVVQKAINDALYAPIVDPRLSAAAVGAGSVVALAAVPSIFTPATVTGLIGSYVAETLALADGANVNSWTDQSSSNVPLTNPGTAPTYRAKHWCGRPTVHFAAGGLARSVASPPTKWTIAYAADWTNAGSSQGVIGGSTQVLSFINFLRITGNADYVYASNTASMAAWVLTCDGTTVTFWRNGRRIGTSTNVATLSAFVLGAEGNSASPSFPYLGDIEEAHLYNRALLPEEITQLSRYIASRVGATVVPAHSARAIATPVISTYNTQILIPESYTNKRPSPLFLHSHGRGGDQTSLFANGASMVDHLLAAGFIVANSAEGGDSWGNDAAIAGDLAMAAYIHTTWGVSAVVSAGSSMGGLPAHRLAMNPSALPGRGLVGTVGFSAIDNMITGSAIGGAPFNTAWGVTAGTLSSAYSAGSTTVSSSVSFSVGDVIRFIGNGLTATVSAVTGSGPYTLTLAASVATGSASGAAIDNMPTKTAGKDPFTAAAATFAGLRWRGYTSAGDTTVPQSESIAFQAKIASVATESSLMLAGLGGHLDVSQFSPIDVTQFALRCVG